MIGFLIALVSGALMSIQGVFNTQVTKSTGIWTASAFVQFTAYGCPGTGQSGNAYCGRSACCSIYYRTVRMVRCGEAALGVAESHRHGRGDCGDCDFQVEMIQSYPRSGNFANGF